MGEDEKGVRREREGGEGFSIEERDSEREERSEGGRFISLSRGCDCGAVLLQVGSDPVPDCCDEP